MIRAHISLIREDFGAIVSDQRLFQAHFFRFFAFLMRDFGSAKRQQKAAF